MKLNWLERSCPDCNAAIEWVTYNPFDDITEDVTYKCGARKHYHIAHFIETTGLCPTTLSQVTNARP